MEGKTVFILGAGFSMESGAPSQARIIEKIFELKHVYPIKGQRKVHIWIDEFDEFLTKSLLIKDDEKCSYSLEDVFTPIDRSIAESISFRGYTPNRLFSLRDKFNRLIILAVRNAIENSTKDKEVVNKFANYIVDLGKSRLKDEKNDAVSIITTNWDIMLDNTVNKIIKNERVPKGKFGGVVDYCCHISSLDEGDEKIKPGLYAIGKGGYNVKILKLHGSLNWLQCPKCQRIYVKYYERWNGGYVFGKKYCRHCGKNFKNKKEESSLLATNLIMPTFLKNIDNVQNKLIWQNAGIELSEAVKVVFLGYSLPHADFEFRQLLSRMIRADANIEVVLIEPDDPKFYEGATKNLTAGYRFSNFFSGRNPDISYKGVRHYVNNL